MWHGSQEKYQRYEQIGGRFSSEFGLATYPQMRTIKSFTHDESELSLETRILDFHNKEDGHERAECHLHRRELLLTCKLEVRQLEL